jgi:hypothetical protein
MKFVDDPIQALHVGHDRVEYARMHPSYFSRKNQWRLDLALELLQVVMDETREDGR